MLKLLQKLTENLLDFYYAPDTGATPANFDPLVNSYIDDVEKFAYRGVELARSTNPLNDAFPEIDVENGTSIEKLIVAMAKSYDFDPTAALGWAQKDPETAARIYSEWNEKQFEVTYRRDEWRKVAMQNQNPEDMAGLIVDSLTEGEGYEDFLNLQLPFVNKNVFDDYRLIAGREPANLDGVLYAARDMYHHITATNATSTEYTKESTTPQDYAIIVMSSKLVDLIDVTKMANIFNMSKAEIIGKLYVFNADNVAEEQRYLLTVLDRRAIIRGKRLFDVTKDQSGRGRFINFFLTVSRLYGICHLFKGYFIDCYKAAQTVLQQDMPATTAEQTPVTLSISKLGTGSADVYGTGKYLKGDTAILSAENIKGTFQGWVDGKTPTGAPISTANPYSFTINEDTILIIKVMK